MNTFSPFAFGTAVNSRRLITAVATLALASLAPWLCAQTPEPTLAAPLTERPIPDSVLPDSSELGTTPTDVSSPLHLQPGNSGSRLENFEQEIERIEMDQGAWGYGLAEQLSGLGESYQMRGRHREAIEVFDRAIHVSRINNGLYDLSQAPIVENMVESLIARGEWQQVHDHNRYLYWLHKRNYGEQDPRMLPVIDKLGRWYINDYAMNYNQRGPEQLIDARTLFENATQIISTAYGESDLRLIDPLRGLVLTNWFFATYQGDGSTSQYEKERLTRSIGPEIDANRFGPDLRGLNNYYGPSGVVYPEDDRSPQLARYVNTSFASGKNAIRQIVDIYSNNPNAPPGAAAAAKVELADWYMAFERWQTATPLYQEAYAALAADESTKGELDKLFGQPVALPDIELMEVETDELAENAGSLEEGSPVELESANFVLVSFDVSRYGEATNISILDSHPEDNVGNRVRAKRSLEHSRFRPRFVEGEPVTTTGMVQRFVFSD